MTDVYLPKKGKVTSQVERDAFAAVIEAAQQALGDRPYFENDDFPTLVQGGLATMSEALAEYDAEAEAERGRQERRKAAEKVARETPDVPVRIRITKRLSFKSGNVLTKGAELDVTREVRAEWDPDTGEWTPEVSYHHVLSRHSSGGSFGLSIPADYAIEV